MQVAFAVVGLRHRPSRCTSHVANRINGRATTTPAAVYPAVRDNESRASAKGLK